MISQSVQILSLMRKSVPLIFTMIMMIAGDAILYLPAAYGVVIAHVLGLLAMAGGCRHTK